MKVIKEIDIEKLKAEVANDRQRRLILMVIFITAFLGFVTLVISSPHLTE